MKKLTVGEHVFEIIDFVPSNFQIWNIGKNMPDGYLPLVQTGGYDGCQVNTRNMRAIKIDGAQTILKAIGHGQNTIEKMEAFIKIYKNSNNKAKKVQVQRLKDALEVMYQIKWH